MAIDETRKRVAITIITNKTIPTDRVVTPRVPLKEPKWNEKQMEAQKHSSQPATGPVPILLAQNPFQKVRRSPA